MELRTLLETVAAALVAVVMFMAGRCSNGPQDIPNVPAIDAGGEKTEQVNPADPGRPAAESKTEANP